MHDAHRVEQLFARRAFEKIALRAGPDRAENPLVGVERREGNGAHRLAQAAQPLQRLHAVHLRHLQVQQHDVGIERHHLIDNLDPRPCLADYEKVSLSG